MAAPLAVAISVLVAAMIVAHDWRQIHVRSAAGLLVAAVLGIPFGLLLLTHIDDRITRRILAAVIIAFSVYSLLPFFCSGGAKRPHLCRSAPFRAVVEVHPRDDSSRVS